MFKTLTLFYLLVSFFFNPSLVGAFKADTFVPLIHEVDDFVPATKTSLTPLEVPKFIYEESTTSAVFNTWVLTPKAIQSATISAYFKKISAQNPQQEIGLFLKQNQVSPLQNLEPLEREVEIDLIMEKFFKVFGFYPKTITANSFDAYTLEYLQKKYSVLGVIVLPNNDQERPSSNGAYSFAPFFPDKKNHYLPAKNFTNRINLVFSEATNFEELNFSQDLPFYAQKYLNEFTLLNLNTSNSSTTLIRLNYKKALKELITYQGKYNLHFIRYSDFSDWFKARFPESSPASLYRKEGPDKVINYLYQSPWYKIEFSDDSSKTTLKSLFIYNHQEYEPNFATPSLTSNFSQPLKNLLEGNSQLILEKTGGQFLLNYLRQTDFWSIKVQNQKEKITLQPDKIIFENLVPPSLSTPLLEIKTTPPRTSWTPVENRPFQNNSLTNYLFWLTVAIVLIFYLFKSQKFPFLGLVLIFLIGLTSFKSGKLYPFGLGFWGPNGHDAIFHLSLIQKFVQEPFNLSHPQISSETLSNYHFIFDYLSALIIKLTQTPPLFFYFCVFPVLAGIVLLKLLTNLFTFLKLNTFQKNVALLFVFLGSSFGFILRFFQGQGVFGGESAFWSNQSASMFLNPPFILSLIFLLAFLNSYQKENKKLKDYLFLIILGSLLAQTKIYAFILLCLALALRLDFLLLIAIGVGGLLINLPFAKLGSFPFIFDPLWFTRSMFQSPDRAYWLRLAEAWQAYEATGAVVKLFAVNLMALAVFIIGNLGVRILGLYKVCTEKVSNNLDGLLKSLIFFSLLLPLLFVQKINPWNSIQFLYYGLFFLSFYTAKSLSKKSVLTYSLIFIGIFGSLGTLKDYTTKNSTARVSYSELSALQFLSTLPKGVVLSPLYPQWTYFNAPQPLYDYVSSSYISALSGQREFLSDTINLEITGIDFHSKANQQKKFYTTQDPKWSRDFLEQNSISYVIETPVQKISLNPTLISLTKIFASNEITIYKTYN